VPVLYFRAHVLLFLTVLFGGMASGFGASQDLVVSHFTGPDGGIGTRDARGTAARFNRPSGIWADGQNLYVADQNNFTIRKISIATADVTTLAGSPQQFGNVDGIGANARFSRLGAVWGDGTSLYVRDGCAVRKVDLNTREVSTFVGDMGNCGNVDGPRNVARLAGVGPMWGDGTNLYWIETSTPSLVGPPPLPQPVRIITLATGSVRSIPLPRDPNGIWGVDGYLYMTFVSNPGSIALGRVNLDTQQFEWLFNSPTSCNCFVPGGLWFDGRDAFYFVERTTVRRLTLSTGTLDSIGTLPAATYSAVPQVTYNPLVTISGAGDDLYVADAYASIVSRVHIPTHEVTVFAGLQSNAPPDPRNGPLSRSLTGVWGNGRFLYTVSDNSVLRTDLAAGTTTLFASGFGYAGAIWGDEAALYVVDSDYPRIQRVDFSTGVQTTLVAGYRAYAIWGDSTYLYATVLNTVQRISKATGDIGTFAGSFEQFGPVDGIGTEARFESPSGIWGDFTYLYIADSSSGTLGSTGGIRRIRISTAEVTTLSRQVNVPVAIVGDGTNLYVGDISLAIKKIVIATGEVTNVLPQYSGTPVWTDDQHSLYFKTLDGTAIDRISLTTGELSRVTPPLQFSEGSVPSDRIQVKASWTDGTFLYGFSGGAIYKVRIANGEIIHIAGAFDEFGQVDGVGNHARFLPNSVWGDRGYLYVADFQRIRRINLATQQVDTFVSFMFLFGRMWGDGQYLYITDDNSKTIERVSISTHKMEPVATGFQEIHAIWGDRTNLYVGDACTIRKVDLATFNVIIVAGVANACTHVDGTKDAARFTTINDIWGNGGLLYVADGHTIRTVDLVTGETRTIAGNPALAGTENGSALDSRFIGPDRIVGDGVNLYVSDNDIRKISTVASTRTFTISANGINYLATPAGSNLIQGYARTQATAGSANADGISIFSYRSGGVLVSETSVQASPLIQSGRVYAESAGALRTGIAIANPNDTGAAITFYFTDKDGANFGGGTTTIPPNQQIAAFLNDSPFNGTATAQTFTFSSSVPVGAVALRGFVNERSDFLMTTLPVAPIASTSSSPIVVPHFAAGGGWMTQILLVNPTDQSVSGSVVMDGASTLYSIAPRSATKVVRSDAGGQVRTGMVIVTPASGNVAPVVSSVFTLVSNGVVVTESGVAAPATGQAFRVLAELDPTRSMRTGIAIANARSVTATIQYDILDLGGQSTGYSGSTTLPPDGHTGIFLNQLPGLQNLPASFRGVLRISSTSPISVVGLRGLYNERGDFLISTTPALADAATSSGEVVFPHLVTGSGYTTEFILMSAGAASSGTLSLRSQSGTELALLPVQ
jgi:hypothetical protein